MWKEKLGAVDVSLVNQEFKVYLDTVAKKNYQVSRAGWRAPIDCRRACRSEPTKP